ncbi:eCIS core domain-containing protein [Streptomyces sp. 7N604]|uniref:eCIS core domain-containing protein n=1 Tax=Streptomyces sp. 7N604 TaxID=3457415 RepID=UPI003FD50812
MQRSKPHTEQTETRQPAHGRAAARRETSGGAAAVPPPLTADALRAVQRGAGNAAVTSMIARRARTTPAPEQPDTGVNEVLRSAGKPLAAPVRQDMESRFGTDFSGVRLHTGAAAARSARAIGARAYTSGSHVVLGDGGGDKHTLAHELTHVVQQRQGPVSGTDHGNGLKLSDPSDRFERAAEENARRVMSGPRPADAGSAAADPGPVAEPEVPHVQRKVGFEFEVTDTTWRFYEVQEGGGKRLKKDTKAALIELPGRLSYVAADNGNVEFVTRPLTTLDEVRVALRDIIAFHDQLSTKKKHTEDSYQIEAAGQGKAKPQATFGIKMEKINDLVESLVKLDQQQEPAGKRRRTKVGDDRSEGEREFKDRVTGTLPGLEEARTHAERIFDSLAEDSAEPVDTALKKEVSGFLTVILKTLYDVEEKNASVDDPKYFFSMMPRTDFVSMRSSLSPVASGWLTSHLQDLYTAMNDIVPNGIDGPVFRGRYKEKPKDAVLTRRQWLDSVFQGAPNTKDLLSPPPGYPRHNETKAPEGVGAMETDDEDFSLFELRDLGGPMEKEKWPGLAEFIAKLVGKATDDERLQERK